VKLPTAELEAVRSTSRTPEAEDVPSPEPVALFAFIERLVTLAEPTPELLAVNCHMGAPIYRPVAGLYGDE
jgi:hypothetical protein